MPTLKFQFNTNEKLICCQCIFDVFVITLFGKNHFVYFGGHGFFFFAECIFVKPLPVVPDGCQSFFGFVNTMAKSFVNDQPRWYPSVLQPAVQLPGIGNGRAFIKFAMLYEGERASAP